jgi:hypothetical protein
LSRQRLCFSTGLWTTILSSVFIEAFISSCIFAPVIVTDNGMPFWSTNTCRLVPDLPLSVGFGPTSHFPPPKVLSPICYQVINCHVHLMPLRSSYSFSSLTHNFWNTFDNTHSWNRLWQVVEPEPYSFGSIFHWHPVIRT